MRLTPDSRLPDSRLLTPDSRLSTPDSRLSTPVHINGSIFNYTDMYIPIFINFFTQNATYNLYYILEYVCYMKYTNFFYKLTKNYILIIQNIYIYCTTIIPFSHHAAPGRTASIFYPTPSSNGGRKPLFSGQIF
jgi:hypothetical protein